MGLLSLKELTLAQNLQLRGLGKSRHVGWAQDETFLSLKTSFVTNAFSPLGSLCSFSLKKKLIVPRYHDMMPYQLSNYVIANVKSGTIFQPGDGDKFPDGISHCCVLGLS